MNAKTDRKALLRSSIQSEAVSVEKRFPAADMNKRYANAEEVLEGRPQGLVGPTHDITPPNFRAEIETSNKQRIVLRVPIDYAHDNPMNARQIYDADVVKSMAASVATRGQLVPAPAVMHPINSGHVILIDGHYRKRALLAAGRNEIEVIIHEVSSELDMYRMSYLINEERNGQSPLDNALAWEKLLEDGKVADGAGVAELTGLSASAVAKTLSLIKLPEAAIAKIRENPTKFGVAIGYEVYRFSKFMDERPLLSLMDRIVSEDLSSRALEQMRAKVEESKPRKKNEVSRQYKILTGSQQIGFIKEWDSGKVVFEVNMLTHHDRAALVEELKRRFELSDTKPSVDASDSL